MWYQHGNDRSPFARQLIQLVDRLGDKYQVDELAGKYEFSGNTPLTVADTHAEHEGRTRDDRPAIQQLRRGREDEPRSA